MKGWPTMPNGRRQSILERLEAVPGHPIDDWSRMTQRTEKGVARLSSAELNAHVTIDDNRAPDSFHQQEVRTMSKGSKKQATQSRTPNKTPETNRDNIGMLAEDQLTDLFGFLTENLERKGCDHSNRLTRQWLSSQKIARPNVVLEQMAMAGGYCDCEILLNVVLN
jgi:Protein of unknown function (DUF2695)